MIKLSIKFFLAAVLGYALGYATVGVAYSKELPVLVDSPQALTAEHDYQRVVLVTWVQAGYERTTRRRTGKITVLEVGSHDTQPLIVVLDHRLYGTVVDRCAVIQGTYRTGGRFGGWLMEKEFLIADAVVIDLTGESCRGK